MSLRWCTRNVLFAALCAAGANSLLNTPPGLRSNNPAGWMQRQQSAHAQCFPRCHLESSTGRSIVTTPQRGCFQLSMASSSSDANREDEIRRKILDLKQEGKIKPKSNQQQSLDSTAPSPLDTPADKLRKESERLKNRSVEEYAEKLGSKLGGVRGRQVGRMLGISVPMTQAEPTTDSDDDDDDDDDDDKVERKPKLGALDIEDLEDFDDDEDDDELYEVEAAEERRESMEMMNEAASEAIGMLRRNVDDVQAKDPIDEIDEQDMMDAVNKALARSGGEYQSFASLDMLNSEDGIATVPSTPPPNVISSTASTGEATSGIGGAWSPSTEKKAEDDYQPKVGTWGAFPRPKNISVAYGGGKRVGAGVKTDQKAIQQSIDSTKDRLKAYREKMGIEVQSEKDYEDVIEEALQLAGRAMQRGSYSIGVSALEKVTQYCSTRSKLGGKVFLELAMAYEADGKTDQAIGLYAALTKSPIEKIKANADKLLFGLEAMNFLRDDVKLEEFSRKKASDTFIDATGFDNMAAKFDDVYATAYIDLDKGGQYYRMLTESVVRSTREARQILLKAVNKGEVDRAKVVQALRSISRHFDEALVAEKKNEDAKNVPVDYAGRPIVSTRRSTQDGLASAIGMDGYVLSTPSQTLDNLDGEWRLQLMADRKGDGVEFFNSTLFWQAIDTSEMAFKSGYKGLRSSSESGNLVFVGTERILSREGATGGGGGDFLSMLFGGGGGTAGEMTKVPLQIMMVDSALIVTRAIVKAQAADNVKDYFSVWRRVEPGTYTKDA